MSPVGKNGTGEIESGDVEAIPWQKCFGGPTEAGGKIADPFYPKCVLSLANVPAKMKREHIFHSNPAILGGTRVFTGTRVPIETLLTYLRKGKPLEDFRDDFPSVTREQAEALLDLAEPELVSLT